jgi:hypothetical protein
MAVWTLTVLSAHRFGDTTWAKCFPLGKPWDRQPVSGKLRRKLGVSPGFATSQASPHGALQSGFTPGAIRGNLPEKFHDMNLNAFHKSRAAAARWHS